MQASITIGGIEVALTTSPGELEGAIVARYAPFLGAVEAPVCSVFFESNRRDEVLSGPSGAVLERLGETKFRVVQRGVFGLLDLAGTCVMDLAPGPALDTGLRFLFGLLAPHHDALLLWATSVIGDDGAQVFLGASESSALGNFDEVRATMAHGLVMVRREASGWLAASTPFGASSPKSGSAREDRLKRLWSIESAATPEAVEHDRASRIVAGHASTATQDPDVRQRALWVAENLACDIPLSVQQFDPTPLTWGDVEAALWAPAR